MACMCVYSMWKPFASCDWNEGREGKSVGCKIQFTRVYPLESIRFHSVRSDAMHFQWRNRWSYISRLCTENYWPRVIHRFGIYRLSWKIPTMSVLLHAIPFHTHTPMITNTWWNGCLIWLWCTISDCHSNTFFLFHVQLSCTETVTTYIHKWVGREREHCHAIKQNKNKAKKTLKKKEKNVKCHSLALYLMLCFLTNSVRKIV